MRKKYLITLALIVAMIVFMGVFNKVNAADVEITFNDENLYRMIVNELNPAITSKDGENYKIVMSEEAIEKVQRLDLTGNLPTLSWPGEHRIKDLSGIENFTKLTTLILDQNLITDITPLSELQDIRVLELGNNTNLKNVSIVQNFSKLEQLTLNSCNISQDNIDAISKCTTLTKLGLHGCLEINDISKLANLTKLQRLWIGRTSITSVDALKDLTTLKELDINYIRNIKSLETLKNLVNLEGLYCCSCSITDITPLSNLTKLTTLRIDDNNIQDISVLSNLTNLKALNASNNHISDTTPIEGREWQGLDLSNQTISMKAKAGGTITLPEIFRATNDSSNIMYIPNEMQYLNCTKVDNNTIKLGNDGEISIIIIGLSQDKDNTFSWDEQYVSNNLNKKMIKSAQGSKLTITLEEQEKSNSDNENKENNKNTEKETNQGNTNQANTNNKESTQNDGTVSSGKLPYTGKLAIELLFIGAIAMIIVFRVKYKKYKDIK